MESVWKTYTSELQRLYAEAGAPSTRALAKSVGGMSHTTVNELLRAKRFPPLLTLQRLLTGMGLEPSRLDHVWQNAYLHIHGERFDQAELPTSAPMTTQQAVLAELRQIRKLLERLVDADEDR